MGVEETHGLSLSGPSEEEIHLLAPHLTLLTTRHLLQGEKAGPKVTRVGWES